MKELNDIECGWLAGVIDGDGSIILRKRSKYGYTAVVKVSNEDEGLIKRLQELIPEGRLYGDQESLENPNAKTCYHYVVGQHNVIYELLSNVMDHLATVKQKRATLMLDYIKLRRNINRNRNADGTFTSGTTFGVEEKEIYERFCEIE